MSAQAQPLPRGASIPRLSTWTVILIGAALVIAVGSLFAAGTLPRLRRQAGLTRQAQQIQVVAKETHNEARRLAAAIDTLNGDRDRLYSRVTSLEQGLDSVTGAIARQGSASASPPVANQEPPAAAQSPQQSPAVAGA